MQLNFQWNFYDLIGTARPSDSQSEFALVILNRPFKADPIFYHLWKNARIRVAADGGANRLYDLLNPASDHRFDQHIGLDAIVGDLDSVRPSVRDYFSGSENSAEIVRIFDQELPDVDKTVNWVHSKCAHGIDLVILGDLGGRVDHGLRQVHYLYHFQPGPSYADGRVFLITDNNLTVLLKAGTHQIKLRMDEARNIGESAAIIAIGKPSVITTHGFERDATQNRLMLGEAMHRSRILQETCEVSIETSSPVLFTIDVTARL